MSPFSRRPSPDEREGLAPSIEGLVLGLFGQGSEPVFEGAGARPEAIRAFARSEPVLEATFDYLRTLMRIWRSQYPGRRLRLTSAAGGSSALGAQAPQAARSEAASSPDPARDEQAGDEPETGRAPQGGAGAEQPPGDGEVPSGAAEASPPLEESDGRGDGSAEQPGTAAADLQPGEVPAAGGEPSRPAEPKASFRLRNAKVGVDYAEVIEGRDTAGRPVAVLALEIPDELGLEFDAGRGELRGVPRADGDFRLPVRWASEDGEESHAGECLLIVNPDPRSLWKVVEPPADAPYPKPHQASEFIAGDGLHIAAASRRGRSHEHAGSFRDDDFFIHQDLVTGWSILVVADGAGSARFSREGARLAAATAGGHLAEALGGELGARMTTALAGWRADTQAAQQAMGSAFHYLFYEAAARAVQAIEQAAQACEAAPKAYATTLLAAAIKRQESATFLASFWLGDGAVAAYGPRGTLRLMGTPDGGDFAGQTRFLDRAALSEQGDKGFAKRVGIGYFPELSAVLLMTDGVSDPRFETDNGLKDPARWDRLWDELRPVLDGPNPDKALLDWLGFFSPGNHDDRTIALLW